MIEGEHVDQILKMKGKKEEGDLDTYKQLETGSD